MILSPEISLRPRIRRDTKGVIRLAERKLDNVELSQEAVTDYIASTFKVTEKYAWELTKLGMGIGLSFAALHGGYDFVKSYPVVENIDWMAHQVKFLPELVGLAAPLFVGVKAKTEIIDSGIGALKSLASKN